MLDLNESFSKLIYKTIEDYFSNIPMYMRDSIEQYIKYNKDMLYSKKSLSKYVKKDEIIDLGSVMYNLVFQCNTLRQNKSIRDCFSMDFLKSGHEINKRAYDYYNYLYDNNNFFNPDMRSYANSAASFAREIYISLKSSQMSFWKQREWVKIWFCYSEKAASIIDSDIVNNYNAASAGLDLFLIDKKLIRGKELNALRITDLFEEQEIILDKSLVYAENAGSRLKTIISKESDSLYSMGYEDRYARCVTLSLNLLKEELRFNKFAEVTNLEWVLNSLEIFKSSNNKKRVVLAAHDYFNVAAEIKKDSSLIQKADDIKNRLFSKKLF